MISGLLALALLAVGEEAIPDAAQPNLALDIDPCVDVDEPSVRALVAIELGGVRARGADPTMSVEVRCTDDAQEILVEPWASRGEEGRRMIQLPSTEDADPAAHDARSRELALAIAELIRRLRTTHPLAPEPPPPPPPPAPPVVISPARPVEEPRGRWRLAVLSSFDTFTGGQRFAGGDIAVAASIGRRVVAELRGGGRIGAGETVPSGQLSARAGTVAVTAGFSFWSQRNTIGFDSLLRAQGYLVEYRAEVAAGAGARSTAFGAVVVAAEPRLLVSVGRRIRLTAAAAVGLPVHGIVVRAQGVETDSVSGLFLSGSLGAMLMF